jgi:cell division protein FtsB
MRPRRILTAICVVIAACALATLFIARAIHIGDLQLELQKTADAQQTALAHQAALRARLLHVNDPAEIESAARRLLGLVYPGEEKVIFIRGE